MPRSAVRSRRKPRTAPELSDVLPSSGIDTSALGLPASCQPQLHVALALALVAIAIGVAASQLRAGSPTMGAPGAPAASLQRGAAEEKDGAGTGAGASAEERRGSSSGRELKLEQLSAEGVYALLQAAEEGGWPQGGVGDKPVHESQQALLQQRRLDGMLQQAQQHVARGRLREAGTMYREVLARDAFEERALQGEASGGP